MTVSARAGRIGAFLVERCLPVYPVYLALWVVAAESLTVVIAGSAGPWRPSWGTATKALALMAAGAFMRMVDDQKDLDYDTLHHPTRPLVQGRITTGELRAAMVPAAAAALALAVAVSRWAVALLAATLAYSLAVWWLETKWNLLRDNAIVNLVAVCPAQFLATGFAMTGCPGIGEAPWWRLAGVPLVFTGALLHAEFARKIARAAGAGAVGDDPHSYSELLGVTASALLACGAGLFAVVAEILVSMPWSWAGPRWPLAWLPLSTAALPLVSAWSFLHARARDHPKVLPTLFVVVFYLSIVGQGLAR
ncbi:hypothetical protein [Mycobacterium sp. Marseille-P9652]|uniref:hypothetical protein n=1 Tax=Mycobacterium sp. Marseille-P9652 TaxID=2654950 RepID=UPI0012E92108|nr:hypothetical protein [Mycobacterium sp. Marseille-P9652]